MLDGLAPSLWSLDGHDLFRRNYLILIIFSQKIELIS